MPIRLLRRTLPLKTLNVMGYVMFETVIEKVITRAAGRYTYDKLRTLLGIESKPVKNVDFHEVESENIANDKDVRKLVDKGEDKGLGYYKERYKTFDTSFDIYEIIPLVKNPLVHVVFEDKPSTAWHLPLVVVEDLVSGEWYVFSKGRLAFEGNGGGLQNSRDLLQFLVSKKIRFSFWVLDFISSQKLSQGNVTWPRVKEDCIPILAWKDNSYLVQQVFKEVERIKI